MAIHLRTNPYRGVNAHLNSFLQRNVDNDWQMFHAAHIDDIARTLDRQLPTGYEVGLEKSLQIREFHPETGERIRTRRPQPDVTVYETGSGRGAAPAALSAAPTMVMPALETMQIDEDELFLRAVIIYEVQESGGRKPVTRIELLSPTNKPPGAGFDQYWPKRDATLRQQMPLVEIDYLHESPPVPSNVPSYPDRDPKAHAYTIYVTDTRPSLEAGRAFLYGFDVDAPFPLVSIPLSGQDALVFDFGAPYNRTFESFSYFSNRVDYSLEPARMETYTPADQERIRARMAAVVTSVT